MIQEYLMNELEEVIPGLSWTIDYFTDDDNTGTVYASSSSQPDVYDTNYRYPGYQVFIRSSDWDLAKFAAEMTFMKLHKKSNFTVDVDVDLEEGEEVVEAKQFLVFFIMAASDPLRIGDNDGIMEYSINFDVTMKEE